MTEEKQLLEQFLLYCDWGWPIVPLHRANADGVCSCPRRELCPAAGKHPVFPGFLKQGSTDKDQVIKWWRQFNHPNFGVLTGTDEGQLGAFILDIDVKTILDVNGKELPNGLEQIQKLVAENHEELPRTVTSRTGNGGYHLAYSVPEGITVKSAVGWNNGPGLDIRSNGTLAVIPPSRNAGGVYTWDNDYDSSGKLVIDRSPAGTEIAPCPAWLLQLIQAASTGNQDYRTRFNTAAALMGVSEGKREQTLFSMASKLRYADVPEDVTRRLVLEAAQKCNPPFPEDEALERVARVYRNYQPNERRWKDSSLEKPQRTLILPAVTSSWASPVELLPEGDPEKFPTEVFPTWVKEFVDSVSVSLQIPSDCPGMFALAALATCAAKKFEVEIKEGWVEPMNLYCCSLLPPGSRKSETFKVMVAPILGYEREIQKVKEDDIAVKKNRRGMLEKDRDNANKEVARKRNAGAASAEIERAMQKADDLTRELEGMRIEYKPTLVESDDITPEALVTRLYEQKGKLAILSPEGGVFDQINGRYSPSGAIEPYLRGHSGDLIRTTRKTREEQIPKPALTIGVSAQPGVLQGAVFKENFRHFFDRGLFARFLFAYPVSNIGYREIEPSPIPLDVRIRYNDNIKSILKFPESPDSEDDDVVPWMLHFSDEAYAIFKEFQQYIEGYQRRGGPLSHIVGWSGKIVGAVARIAGLLHLASNINEDSPAEIFIPPQTVENACVLGSYLIHHALRTFNLMTKDGSEGVAICILDWLKSCPRDTFLYQEIIQVTKAGKPQTFKALEVLRNNGYIKIASTDRSNPQFEVNPIWMSQYKKPPTLAEKVEEFAAVP